MGLFKNSMDSHLQKRKWEKICRVQVQHQKLVNVVN